MLAISQGLSGDVPLCMLRKKGRMDGSVVRVMVPVRELHSDPRCGRACLLKHDDSVETSAWSVVQAQTKHHLASFGWQQSGKAQSNYHPP